MLCCISDILKYPNVCFPVLAYLNSQQSQNCWLASSSMKCACSCLFILTWKSLFSSGLLDYSLSPFQSSLSSMLCLSSLSPRLVAFLMLYFFYIYFIYSYSFNGYMRLANRLIYIYSQEYLSEFQILITHC